MKPILLAILLIGGAVGICPVATAHPMGNISINHYSRITVSPGVATVRYVLDYAEIPTVAERQAMGAGQTGPVSDAAERAYLASVLPGLVSNLSFAASGAPVPLTVQSSSIAFREGAGALPTMRLVADLSATMPQDVATISYSDGNYTGRAGWKEVVVKADGAEKVSNAAVLGRDISRELTVYPTDLLSAPPQATSVSFAAGPYGATLPEVAGAVASSQAPRMGGSETPRDRFTQAIASKKLTLPIILLGLVIAFVYGGLHAMSPGHGKTMVAAYLVGQRGTIKHALLLGGVVTLTHTFGVFLLGFVTLFASRYILPERLFPFLSVVSGLAVFGVGVWMLVTRLKGDGTAHSHNHDHADDHADDHSHAPAMQLAFATASGQAMSHDEIHRLGLAHVHDQEHEHVHTHDPMHDHSHEHDHVHDHHHHDDGLDAHGGHRHGIGGYHSHTVPDGPITLKSLVALGVSGGIVPCPSALVVLLSAIALHRLGYGMLLITAFSLGLATVLVAIGVLVVTARGWLDRIPATGKAMRFLPIASAVGITVIGAILVVQAIVGIGV